MTILTLTTAPPAPAVGDVQSVFDTKAFPFAAYLAGLSDELNPWAAEVQALGEAVIQVATAVYSGTSTSAVTPGLGAKSFPATSAGRGWVLSQVVRIVSRSNPANYLIGTITSYDRATGALAINATDFGGAGSPSDWEIGLEITREWGSLLNRPPLVLDLAALPDPNADRLTFWDDSAGALTWLQLGANLSITGTTLNAEGGDWTQIATATPTGVSQVDFASIPTTYNELLLVVDGVSHGDGTSRSLSVRHSPDGTTFNASPIANSATVAAASSMTGGLQIPGYRYKTGVATYGLDVNTVNPGAQTGAVVRWLCTGGIAALRVLWSGGVNFTAGTLTLYGR